MSSLALLLAKHQACLMPKLYNPTLIPARTKTVHATSRRHGYEHKFEYATPWEATKTNLKVFPTEIKKFGSEIKDFGHDILWGREIWKYEHGDYQTIFKLDSEEKIKQWTVSTDADMDVGFSKGEISVSKNKCLLWTGFLDQTLPRDGKTEFAGYVNIKPTPPMKSFFRPDPWDWRNYTHLIIRCKGDRRQYNINLEMNHYFDIMWHDIYRFHLFTRGGPYWQTAKIPFSKFYLTHFGKIQDKQEFVPNEMVRNISFTLMDNYTGPYQLEIDYIGVVYDAHHTNKFFYEMYDDDPFFS